MSVKFNLEIHLESTKFPLNNICLHAKKFKTWLGYKRSGVLLPIVLNGVQVSVFLARIFYDAQSGLKRQRRDCRIQVAFGDAKILRVYVYKIIKSNTCLSGRCVLVNGGRCKTDSLTSHQDVQAADCMNVLVQVRLQLHAPSHVDLEAKGDRGSGAPIYIRNFCGWDLIRDEFVADPERKFSILSRKPV